MYHFKYYQNLKSEEPENLKSKIWGASLVLIGTPGDLAKNPSRIRLDNCAGTREKL